MKKRLLILFLMIMLLSNCNGQSVSELLNGTATPTFTPTSTAIIIPIGTNTPQPQTIATTAATQLPDEFVEKEIPEIGLSLWMPDDWYYKYAEQGSIAGFFVSKENIEEYGLFSTGLTVNVVSEVEDPTALVDKFINGILSAETTKDVLSQDNRYLGTDEDILFRACYINAELEIDPNDPDPASEKTIIYMGIADTDQNRVYILFFESPTRKWEDAWLNNGVYITQSVIESIDKNSMSANSH